MLSFSPADRRALWLASDNSCSVCSEPVLRSRSQRRSSQRLMTPPASSPKLPRLCKEEHEGKHEEEEEEETPRRITRHAYQEEVASLSPVVNY